MTLIEPHSNGLGLKMHVLTLHELNRMRVHKKMPISRVAEEETVILGKKSQNGWKQGSFDFMVHLDNGKRIGVEVLARPTHGKLKRKLAYLPHVDQFVFVIPHLSLEAYFKHARKPYRNRVHERFLDQAFADSRLHVWLLDVKNQAFEAKQPFNKIFNVTLKT